MELILESSRVWIAFSMGLFIGTSIGLLITGLLMANRYEREIPRKQKLHNFSTEHTKH